MKSQVLFIITHGAVALAATGAALAFGSFTSLPTWAVVGGVSLATAVPASLLMSFKLNQGVKRIRHTFDDPQKATGGCGIGELDQLTEQLAETAKHYEQIRANERRHSREIKAILAGLSRRGGVEEPDVTLLKKVIGSIGKTLSELMQQVEHDALQIGRCTREITVATSSQVDTASKTEALVNRLSENLAELNARASAIGQQIAQAEQAIDNGNTVVAALTEGVGKIRSCGETSKNKLRALCDPTRRIVNLVSTIGDVAARTEMLALNASIESIRAGEHGRSFAVVADEIRKLAEQTSDSANEIGMLAESLESQTNDSIAVLDRETAAINDEAQLITSIESCLRDLTTLTQRNIADVSSLAGQHANQQQTVQNVLSGIESLSGIGQNDRAKADHAVWAVKSLAKVALDLDTKIHRLRACGDPNAPHEPALDPQLVAFANQIDDPATHLPSGDPPPIVGVPKRVALGIGGTTGMSNSFDLGDPGSEYNAVPIVNGVIKSQSQSFTDAFHVLADLEDTGVGEMDPDLGDTISLLRQLADAMQACGDAESNEDCQTIAFVIQATEQIQQLTLLEEPESIDRDQIAILREEVESRLGVINGDSETADAELNVEAPSADEIAAMLQQLSATTSTNSDPSVVPSTRETPAIPGSNDAPSPSEISAPAADTIDLDDELREAFMDDASRGLASMEQALLEMDSSPDASEPLAVVLRELHTIKGASASVGMENLAGYIHDVEEFIRHEQDNGRGITSAVMFRHVDVIRCRVEGDEIPAASSTPPTTDSAETSPSPSVSIDPNTTTRPTPPAPTPQTTEPATQSAKAMGSSASVEDETVRVKASQLGRLMDMLSELVMLRNRRDTEIRELKQIHDELTYCVTRMRMLSHEGEALLAMDKLADAELAAEGVSFSRLNEVASDVMDSAQRLHDCYQPVAEGNKSVSRFIRNFRLELTQLSRTPVAGLFRRLHRAIHDAARMENKQVKVELIGENTGIERSLQERIFEPLLHIVRNSVGHGIESPQQRQAKGKPATGIVTLHAYSGPDLLVIEVRDDGGGLDYDAIRRRGIERGLISPDASASRAELAQLIFHPGFSTRQTADQLSGRGVGMDVVASTLERMRGWVEIESETGLGSTIRLSLPLPSLIQHVIVFRSGGQLFALPAQSIRRAGDSDSRSHAYGINEMLNLPEGVESNDTPNPVPGILELTTSNGKGQKDGNQNLAIVVDRVLGPEEVVVRPVPTLLKQHPVVSGATLSGMGEVVLLLDPRSLVTAARSMRPMQRATESTETLNGDKTPRVLVVDDSKSARVRVVRALQRYRVTIDEFEDGQAAWEALATQNYDVVFSDIDMPRMSGLELLESIKQDTTLSPIPVVMISSRAEETAGKHALSLGALEYIQKPLEEKRLDQTIEHFAWQRN